MLHPRSRCSRKNFSTESLEVRTLLAGNVLATFAGGDLTLTGDHGDTRVQISPLGNGFLLTGLDYNGPTTVNGQAMASFATLSGIEDINANMKGGRDWIDVNVPISGNINAKMGAGADTFKVLADVGGDVLVKMGKNSGGMGVNGATVSGDVRVLMGRTTAGDTGMTFENSHIQGNATVKGGGGPQQVTLEATIFDGDVDVSLGGGRDRVFIREFNQFGGEIKANGGGGNQDHFFNFGLNTVSIKGFEFFN